MEANETDTTSHLLQLQHALPPIALRYNCHRRDENTQTYLTGIVEIFKKFPITLESWAEEEKNHCGL